MQGYSPHDTNFYILNGRKTWMQDTQANGVAAMWRTDNGGATWSKLAQDGAALGPLLRFDDGSMLLGSTWGLMRSPDGIDWTFRDIGMGGIGGFVQAGDTIVASSFAVCHNAHFPNGDAKPYATSTDQGTTWTQIPSPEGLHQGGKLDFDAAHGIVYSSNCQDGFWRMKLRP
jgi:photosystem II stability/assembly factor-like uncharacterized protein